MRFAAPEYLALLWLCAALAAARLVAGWRRGRRARAFAEPGPYSRLAAGLGRGRRALRDALRLLAAASLVLALARPQFGQRLAILKREGIDVVVAIDTSASMLAEDLKPNRLEAAKRAVAGLIDRLRGDRIGIVVFSGSAFIQCPLTLDGKAARLLLDAVGPEIVPDPGTALGSAIDRATNAFQGEEKRFKALVLFTDGEETAGDPIAAAKRAAEKGVRMFTVGLGAERGEPIPVRNPRGAVVGYKKDRRGEVVLSRLDEATLKRLAEIGSGRYFRASPALSELDALYGEIDAMEKREFQSGFHAHYEDRFHWFAVAAFVLLAAARLLGESRRAPRLGSAGLAAALLVTLAPAARAGAASEVRAGNAAYARGQAEKAVEHYVRALEAEPGRPEIQYDLGNALYAARRYGDAEAAYGVAGPKADSVLAGPLSYNLGNALFRAGKYEEAVAAYKAALRRNPADEDARWNLEVALRKLKEEEEQQQQKQEQQQQQQDKQEQQDRRQQNQEQDPKQQDQGQQQPQEQQQDQSQQQQAQGGQGGADNASTAQDSTLAGREMSAAEAARLLEGLGNDEQNLLRERFRARGRRIDVDKDW